MRIGITTSVIQQGKTGVAQYVFALVRALRHYRREHQFVLFVLEKDLSLFDFATEMRVVPVPEEFRPPVKNILWHQAQLPRFARREQLDVLHVPSYRRLLWPRPCGLVGTIHDLAPFHVSGKYDWKRMLYGRVVARRLAHRQDEVIAISRSTQQDLLRFFRLPSAKVTVIYNGIDHARFCTGDARQAKEAMASKYGLRKPFFLYTARLEHPGKNHVRLVAAYDRFRSETRSDWQLVFAGSDWHGVEAIQSAIASSPFGNDIRRLGFVPDDDLPQLYRAADVFVYPSLFEGFGLPPLEAMACGCPVICSTRGSLGEVVGDAAVVVDPESAESIGRELLRLFTDRDTRERLRGAGLRQAAQFDWKRAAGETMAVYDRASHEHKARRRSDF